MWDPIQPANLKSALHGLARRRLELPVKGEAAVLFPIIVVKASPKVLLTRRTENVGTHKGQVSFPGGKRDAADQDPVETALRETREELGIQPESFEVLGRFHDYLSITEYRVCPIIAICHRELKLKPNPAEVASVLQIPLDFFLKHLPREETHLRLGKQRTVYFYDYGDEVIWGLTASIIRDFCGFLSSLREGAG